MVSTEIAKERLSEGNSRVEFQPQQMAQTLKESAFFRQLDPQQQLAIHKLIGGSGFDDNALSMSFPYMAPDNNNRMFARLIARFFVVNRNQKAVKHIPGDGY